MKLLAPTILFTAALASVASANAAPDLQEPGIQKRQGFFDNLQDSFNDAINNAGNLFNVGHAGEDSTTEENDNNADTAATSASSTPARPSSASSKDDSATSERTSPTASPTASSSSKPNSTENSDDATTKKDEETKTEDSKTEEAKPTGEPCSNDGEKQCANAGSSSAYKLCQDGFWIDQKCGGSDVCGTDSLGAIACIDKNKPVVQLESCSKKKEQRCDANDRTKYQICDGKYWQSYSCDDNKQCSISNKKAVCGSTDNSSGNNGYDPSSYSPITQLAYVPESSANARAAVAGSAMALAVAAGLLC